MSYMKYVRWALTIALLVIVWRHAHWSVALSLCLLTLATEGQTELWRTLAGKAGRRDTR